MSAARTQGGAAYSAAGGLPVLTQAYLAAHVVGTAGSDVIWGPLYDSLAYPSAGQMSFTFFNQGVGAGTTSSPGAGTGAKTLWDTNIITPNMLTMGNEFYAIGSETHILPGVQNTTATPFALYPSLGNATPTTNNKDMINDLWAIGNGGLKVLTVGTDRKYINDGPLMQFPPAKWLQVAAAIAELGATTTNYVSEIAYAAWGGEPYQIVPIYLQSNQNFTLTIGFAAALATPSQTVGRLIERLRGYLIRSVT